MNWFEFMRRIEVGEHVDGEGEYDDYVLSINHALNVGAIGLAKHEDCHVTSIEIDDVHKRIIVNTSCRDIALGKAKR